MLADERRRPTEALDGADALPAILDVGLLGIADEVVAHRLVLVAADELVDITVERGGEEHRLALLRHHVEQLHDLGQEAEIGHAIGLVDHGDLDRSSDTAPRSTRSSKPTWAGDDQRCTAAQRCQLGAVGHPAVDGEDVSPARLTELDELGADLLRQLAGGDEDDAGGVVGFGAADAGEHRDAEGEWSCRSRWERARRGRARRGRRAGRRPARGTVR